MYKEGGASVMSQGGERCLPVNKPGASFDVRVHHHWQDASSPLSSVTQVLLARNKHHGWLERSIAFSTGHNYPQQGNHFSTLARNERLVRGYKQAILCEMSTGWLLLWQVARRFLFLLGWPHQLASFALQLSTVNLLSPYHPGPLC